MKTKHIALIPARKGSVGFKFKNRLFFDNTANFLDNTLWFDDIIVSSDDNDILDKALMRNYAVHNRSIDLSMSDISIKDLILNVIEEMKIDSDSYIWLFYLHILYKNKNDFEELKSLISATLHSSVCSFIPAQVHPFNCWMFNKENLKLKKYNDIVFDHHL